MTFVGPTWDFTIQDETAGIYVHPCDLGKVLKPGAKVTIEAKTSSGAFAPCLADATGKVIGTAPLPNPFPIDLSADDARWLAAQRVRGCCGIREVRAEKDYTVLEVFTPQGTGTVEVVGQHAPTVRSWIGRSVWVSGVCLPRFDDQRRVTDRPRIMVPSLGEMTLVPGSESRATAPPMLIDALFQFTPSPAPTGRLVKVEGTVTAATTEVVYVRDPTGTVEVHPHPPAAVQVGDRVEASGFVTKSERRVELLDARVRKLTVEVPPIPVTVNFETDLGTSREFNLVRGEAIVREVSERPDKSRVVQLQTPNGMWLVAVLHSPASFPDVPPGTRVTVTGVHSTALTDGFDIARFGILMRTGSDIAVVELPPRPSFWTQQRAALAAAALAALVILGAIWLGALRLRVSKQTRQIRAQHAQERLLDARYRDLFETAGDAVWVTDRDNMIVALNQAAEELLKTTRERAIGLPIAGYISPDETELTRASRVRHRDEPFELELIPESGPRVIVEVTSRLLPNGGVQTVARNVTERKKLQMRTQQAQTLEALGRMAGGIAHDFNNLLTVINGSAAALVDQLPTGEPNRALAGEVLGAGTRAANLTRRLLSFSRPRMNASGPVDLTRAVSDSAGLLRRLVGTDVELEVELAPDTPWVRGDVGLIEQILMNLCVNARDAMPSGGTLTVRTGRTPSGAALLTVSDTGTGMTPEVQARVFEPFFTTKEVGKGTGLGLATVYAAVQALGGHIRLYSEVGRGTTFAIDLPSAPEPNEDTVSLMPASVGISEPTPVPDQAWGIGKTALLVEDDDAIRAIAERGLSGHGLQVEVAQDGAEALAIVEELGGQVNLLVTDLMMPGVSGVELAQRVRALQPNLRVVFMSGYDADEIDTTELPNGTWSFLRKPFVAADVGVTARDLIRGARAHAVRTSE